MHRAVERREAVQADSGLTSYRARAHGFVFFLAQVGEGLAEPPRLVKADELDVDVYWQAPTGASKSSWAGGTARFLPTDINYHRDHLGIVTNNFGNMIRIGEGDEVRDAAHPLSPAGLQAYDFALSDSLPSAPPKARSRSTGFRYAPIVCPAAGDRHALSGRRERGAGPLPLQLYSGRRTWTASWKTSAWSWRMGSTKTGYWLPYRQEIEIRRRATWLDFPARGIIRGRWEIRDYQLNPDCRRSCWVSVHRWADAAGKGRALEPAARPGHRRRGAAGEPAGHGGGPGEIERIAGSRVLIRPAHHRVATGS